ncbi:MAG: hypothetical protein ACLTBF_04155 [Christensenellales bacterium]
MKKMDHGRLTGLLPTTGAYAESTPEAAAPPFRPKRQLSRSIT